MKERLKQTESERAAAEAREQDQRKRRRVQVVLAGAILLLLVTGSFGVVIASLWCTFEANHAEAVSQRVAADTARSDAEKARERVAVFESRPLFRRTSLMQENRWFMRSVAEKDVKAVGDR